ncbi:MAG: tRNA (N(6)-L-threonylcarbamoyladenosine(37)-C(2))-methylthiotransferase MtaB [Deltaproteobacteria bacterium]|nr:MAG: tRNA (N(6)-L-threonylcarbamoyladenosine(37)-C(2))-methylthiotransferase MtaB [Deltaproteobacteria bacterium]
MPCFRIITLGCKVNQCESAFLEHELEKAGWKKVEKGKAADLFIINTCIVTQKASHQSRQEIRRAIKENPKSDVIVTGCYAQVYPEELLGIKGISLIVGNKGKEKIPELVNKLSSLKQKILVETFSRKEPFVCMNTDRFLNRSRAFLKIQDGCESFCSYCIVPYARGPYRSMKKEDVLQSIEKLLEKGYKEVVLTGIHLGKYGIDTGESLEELLKEIGKQNYPLRIRLSSIEPNEISDMLIELVAEQKFLCKHFHIPLQSGDNRILKRMNRKYTREQFYELISKIKKKIPFAGIGTDVMVGFPGEDEEAFRNTLSLVKELPLSYMHVFPYSDRPKTAAFYFKDKVSSEIIKKRAKMLREIAEKKKEEFLKLCNKKVFEVVVESKYQNGFLRGITENYIKVIFPSADKKKGEYLKVQIEGSKKGIALGRVV